MNQERIGGHLGMDVFRDTHTEGGVSTIRKQALHDIGNEGELVGVDLFGMNETAIHNEVAMLDIMKESGFTPEWIEIDGGRSVQSDVGITEPPRDGEAWRHNLIKMLATIRGTGLRHGDLKGANIITVKDRPFAVDWQESHRFGDVAPQKSPLSDSYMLMQHIEGTADADGHTDIPRVARRWKAVLGSLGAVRDVSLPLYGKTFLDLGCFQGDFVALAACEGMTATGIDLGGFRTGENSVAIGNYLWANLPYGRMHLLKADIMEIPAFTVDVVIMFSTWPYIVQQYGFHRASNVLKKIIEEVEVFFFETQYHGDGPGPDFLKEDWQVHNLFKGLGAKHAEPIATFPVTGHDDRMRTVWRIQR